MDGDKPLKKKFKAYAIGYFHIDLAEVQTAEGKLYLYVAIDTTSEFAFVQLVERTKTAADFLEALVAAVPYEVHTVLTDNGVQFADIPKNRNGPTARFRGHPFDRACWRHGIEHRLTKPRHPWTNGQIERMNRTIKESTVKRFHYDNHMSTLKSCIGAVANFLLSEVEAISIIEGGREAVGRTSVSKRILRRWSRRKQCGFGGDVQPSTKADCRHLT